MLVLFILYNLKNFGIRGEEVVVDVGANAKMNEFCAIMGLCNLKRIEDTLNNRKERYEYYQKKLGEIKGIRFFEKNKAITLNYAYFPILIEEEYGRTRDELYDLLKQYNIYSRKYFYPITSDQACFRNKYKNVELYQARKLAKQVLVLPFYEMIQIEQMDNIINIIEG